MLEWAYRTVTDVRNNLFDKGIFRQYRASIPVVSVGNITVGGNGKTPLTMYLVQKLTARGFAPVILSRGYGGKISGPYAVHLHNSPSEVGDEPLLLKRESGVPVVVSSSRAEGARYIEREGLGDIIVLDDGFQHRWLRRNCDILCIDVTTEEAIEEFCRGALLPQGRFRETRDRALKRADIVVLMHRSVADKVPSADPRILKLIPDGVSIYRGYLTRPVVKHPRAEPVPLKGASVSLVAAIANPQGFEDSVTALGYHVASARAFKDHHVFTPSECEEIRVLSEQRPVICTSKDYVKLESAGIKNLFVLRAELAITPEDAFIVEILRHCRA